MNNTEEKTVKGFNYYKKSVLDYELPEKFTYPFYYETHPLCLIAAEEVQEYLLNQTDFVHDFGIDHFVDGINIGKMFGVLVVQNEDNEIGYLKAFSGKLAEKNERPGFIPPIFDRLKPDSFYNKEEKEIVAINSKIYELEANDDYLFLKKTYDLEKELFNQKISDFKEIKKEAREGRRVRRENAKLDLSEEEFELFNQELIKESFAYKDELKKMKRIGKDKLNEIKVDLDLFENEINQLKIDRKSRSANLQTKVFDQYHFLNIKGERKPLVDIFDKTYFKVPPAGAGDCALPKLLQYAFIHNLKPIAMAEFWWGQSPKSEIRKHGYFYPSCKGKCYPILQHMLDGIEVEKSPLQTISTLDKKLITVYEDDYLLVINKPDEFLSVPGRNNKDSVFSRMKERFPDVTGPLVAHRLDRSTSGLMIIVKSLEVYKELQKQFIDRTIKKRYIALIEGILKEKKGIIDLPLRPDYEDRPRQLVCYEYGKPSITNWEVIGYEKNYTKLYLYPQTGRTHQLRMHTAHSKGLNMPIVGDSIYGKLAPRLYLHAEKIEFTHPVTKERKVFIAEADF